MGSICYAKEQQLVLNDRKDSEKDRITLSGIEALQSLIFEFSTEKLIHVNADVLVLFNDLSANIRRNDHFTKLPMQGAKLQEHAKAHIQKLKVRDEAGSMKPHFTTFNIIIPTLNFSKVSILFCNMWKQGEHNETQFKELLREYFDSLANEKIQSMAITQFTSELGVHLQKGVKKLLHEIVKMPTKPKSIEFCCLSDESKSVYLNAVQQDKEDLEKSFGSSRNSDGSSYY